MDNPQAFPTSSVNRGMTLRDYFAAATFPAVMFRSTGDRYTPEEAAKTAYRYADAMLAERRNRA